MTNKWRVAPWALMLIAAAAGAQQSPAPGTRFDVASVKPNHSGVEGARLAVNPGRVALENVDFKTLIRLAFHVPEAQMQTPAWAASARYDVIATTATPVPENQILALLRPLLAEQFKLASHFENRSLPIYALVVGGSSPKLQVAATAVPFKSWSWPGGAHVEGSGDLADFCAALSRWSDRPVVDASGLAGNYSFKLEWQPTDPNAPASSLTRADAAPVTIPKGARPSVAAAAGDLAPGLPSLFSAVQETLGLKLEARKGPLPVLVVDHLERLAGEKP
ncbi:MAG TPA: TIGR03435 family protein [Terriglobales bacterium]|nr:TIGR03435 family protein [Terriglobales bacterium]